MRYISRRELSFLGAQFAAFLFAACKVSARKSNLQSGTVPDPVPARAPLKPYVIDEFKGITLDGTIVPNLFPLTNSNIVDAGTDKIDASAILRQVNLYLAELSKYNGGTFLQRNFFNIDDNRWRKWVNFHTYPRERKGANFEEIGPDATRFAHSVLEASLSPQGFELAKNVMTMNEYLGKEVIKIPGRANDAKDYSQLHFTLSVFTTDKNDTPDSGGNYITGTKPWGWQIEGHHLVINYVVVGNRVVMTPAFFGAEPTSEGGGKFLFQEEERDGFNLVRNLSPEERAKAWQKQHLPDLLTSPGPGRPAPVGSDLHNRDNIVINRNELGVKFSELNEARQKQLLDLVKLYTSRQRPDCADIWYKQIEAMKNELSFAFSFGFLQKDQAGNIVKLPEGESALDPEANGKQDLSMVTDQTQFYYRIYSPLILIEFDNPDGLAFHKNENSRYHVHTIVRTPNGNDYGRSYLAQHYAENSHAPDSPHMMYLKP